MNSDAFATASNTVKPVSDTGLALRSSVAEFIDRFVADEFELWIGDVVRDHGWLRMRAIDSIARRADSVAPFRIEAAKKIGEPSVEPCERCGRETMLRPQPSTGASCVRCGYVHIATPDVDDLR